MVHTSVGSSRMAHRPLECTHAVRSTLLLPKVVESREVSGAKISLCPILRLRNLSEQVNTNTIQLIGALGFTLCGALGPAYDNSGAQYEASLATFWGSWAFLIGSLIQWYESLDKHPVIERSNQST